MQTKPFPTDEDVGAVAATLAEKLITCDQNECAVYDADFRRSFVAGCRALARGLLGLPEEKPAAEEKPAEPKALPLDALIANARRLVDGFSTHPSDKDVLLSSSKDGWTLRVAGFKGTGETPEKAIDGAIEQMVDALCDIVDRADETSAKARAALEGQNP